MKLSSGKIAVIVIFAILAIDQVVKIWIKTHMALHESIPVFGNWFSIYFTENPGMAFGLKFGGEVGKIFLTVFRIALVALIGVYISRLIKRGAPLGVMVGIALIFAGAVGNIIDSLFYGLLFSGSEGQVATLFPAGGGYAPFLQGKVVDMLYFPIIETTFPTWLPVWGGEEFIFFRPIFNIADSAITTGVIYLLLFKRGYFLKK
ncbi:MAG: lipoprotein signal peptidase [Prevotellaceae bacterium]|jgi:signal peptidase II|nr:lipoprotein signal peptidase [Prevotellaceae bacterium]